VNPVRSHFIVPPTAATTVLSICETIDAAVAGRAALDLATQYQFTRVKAYYIVTAIIELANNIILHADCCGTVTLWPHTSAQKLSIDILVIDHGPGIADIHQALADGFSTNGGLGCGLPGVMRLMDEFDIQSSIGQGTQIWTRKWR
jgi:serine/threonine-protein kinase RsbT